ncbi:MAG: zinc-dependent metalloprotease family protein [Steroidobacteraceae bacterium]
MSRVPSSCLLAAACLIFVGAATAQPSAPMRLFSTVAPSTEALPGHFKAARSVVIDRRALHAPVIELDLFGRKVVAIRERTEQGNGADLVWVGHLQGNPLDQVILAVRDGIYSGMIQQGARMFRLTAGRRSPRLVEIDLASLPPDDADVLPDGGGEATLPGVQPLMTGDTVQQDLLVVYTQGACNAAGSCSQLEADIAVAVSDINAAYLASGIHITMNLVGTAQTSYTGTDSFDTLVALTSTTDGQMDEIHPLRDQLGADIVSLIYDGQGCGIAWLTAEAGSAFNVTYQPCLVGNRTMAHEIGHNQGAHHDRVTVGDTPTGTYNYGFRRCNDSSVDDLGSPYFRTILAYDCAPGVPRVGRFSNPDVLYSDVPQGVDPNLDPARGAHNARRLNERAQVVAGFRQSPVTEPPAAPSNLLAAATGSFSIDLSWLDNASNEQGQFVQRSEDLINWVTVASLSANVQAYVDEGLNAGQTYYYRLYAQNSAGASDYSNTASATTNPLPISFEDLAMSDLFATGIVSGTYLNTQVEDGSVQSITETGTGSKRNRRQAFVHGWTFDVAGGAGGVVLTAIASMTGSEGASFRYSTDGGQTWNNMFTVDQNALTPYSFNFPPGVQGPLRVEARDAAQVGGEAVDTLRVDYLAVTSYTQPGEPPLAPADMTLVEATSGSVALAFTDRSDDEFGFELRRASQDPGSNCAAAHAVVATLPASAGTGSISALDTTVSPDSTYWYWATAFNGAGDDGGCTNAVPANTPAAPAISATATGRKVKGFQVVDLTWSGVTTSQADVRRNGVVVASPADTGSYTDNLGIKGTAVYEYQVCEQGSAEACSAPITVVF